MPSQPAILQPQRCFARYLTGYRRLGVEANDVRVALLDMEVDESLVVGLGPGLARYLGQDRLELKTFPSLTGVGSCQTNGPRVVHARSMAVKAVSAVGRSKR